MLWLIALQLTLAERLCDNDIAVRDQACEEVRKRGRSAFPDLDAATRIGDLDAVVRAQMARRWIELDEALPPILKRQLPCVVDRLVAGDDVEWTRVFYEAQTAGINSLSPLAIRALKGAGIPEAKLSILTWIREHPMAEAGEAVVPLLGDASPWVRISAIQTLRTVWSCKAASALVPLLADLDASVRGTAARSLKGLDAGDAVLAFVRELAKRRREGEPPLPQKGRIVRDPCDSWGRSPRPPVLADELLELFGERVLGVLPDLIGAFGMELVERAWFEELAIEVRRGTETLPDIAPLLDHPAGDVRRAAACFAGMMRADACVPRLRRALADEDVMVVAQSCHALGVIGVKEAIHEMKPLLKHASSQVRRAALSALCCFRDPDLRTAIEAMAQDPDESIQERAIEELRRK